MSFTWSPLLAGGALLLGAALPTAPLPTAPRPTYPQWRPRSRVFMPVVTTAIAPLPLASGTTLAAMQAGSFVVKYTVAIEGYPYLLTDATPQQAIDAWNGETATSYYTQAHGGLYIQMDNSQQLDWRNPFTRGGHCTLHVVQTTPADTFGVDTHKRNAGQQNELAAAINRINNEITVVSTTGFAASGEAWIGTECFGYTGKNSTQFTGVRRGKYAPMACDPVGTGLGVGFAEHHRVGNNSLEVKLQPLVTSLPRTWIGKWVAVHAHKLVDGALNSRDDALRVFAGRIVAITDDPATGATVVEIKHVLDSIAETTVGGRDRWSGRIADRIQLTTGDRFRWRDSKYTGTAQTFKTANDLVVVAGTPANVNQVQAGLRTLNDVLDAVNGWLAAETAALRLHGTHSLYFQKRSDGMYYATIRWYVATAALGVTVEAGFPSSVNGSTIETSNRFGFKIDKTDNSGSGATGTAFINWTKSGIEEDDTTNFHGAITPYYRSAFTSKGPSGAWEALITNEEGTFVDQFDSMPTSMKPTATAGSGYGLFVVNNSVLAVGYKDGDRIKDFWQAPEQFGLGAAADSLFYFPLKDNDPDWLSIRQIFVIEMPFGDFLKRVIKSTGTLDYNDNAWDDFAYGLGVGVPHEIAGSTFLSTIDALPHQDLPIVCVIDKSTRLSDLLSGELILRRAFLRWKEGGLQFATWKSPTSSNSLGTLIEDNKAAPAGTIDHHRSVTSEDVAWAAPIIKIQYNRSITGNPEGADQYRDSLTIIDKTALDDMGGEGPTLTISCRGTFGDFMSTGSSIGSLANNFMASMPLFSRPSRKSSRSIDQRFFEGYAIGDVVTVTDDYARDPDTGLRGVATRYGIVIRHRYSLGGFTVNSDQAQSQGGEVDLFFLDVNRLAAYVPCAQVDDTAANGGYNAVTGALTVYATKHSTNDASYFVAGDRIRIVEIDPPDPAAPLSWDRIISTVSGNVITPTVTLSSPAWDATKKYRIIFDDYADAVATQQTKTFQAAGSTAMIVFTRAPFEYGIGGGTATFTAWAGTDPVELIPNASYGDGVGRDVGHEVALIRLLNNLMNYKTAYSTPWMSATELNTEVAGGIWTRRLVLCGPIYLGADIPLVSVYRTVAVAPFFKSSDGTSASVRVTLSATPPTDTDTGDVDRGADYSEVTFTTTSTTYATPATQNLTNLAKSYSGEAWIYVECTSTALTYGLSIVQEGPLVY